MIGAAFRPVTVVVLTTALTGCLFQDKVESFSGATMGSTYTVKYVAADSVPDKAELLRQTETILAEIDKQVSTYRADSAIETFNELPGGQCMKVPVRLQALFQAGQRLSDESHGALDLTIEPLLNLWGFGPQGRGERVPSAQEIATARQDVGQHHLILNGDLLCKDRAVQVAFNSIAAGYAVDQVSASLEASGVSDYLVEITGELKAQGRKPDGSPWRIAIEAPRTNERAVQRVIELDGLGVSTSGDYRNYFERDGKRYSHTLDPSTGAPIVHHLAAVTVVDPSTLRADGLSTVLMVLGPERGLSYAKEHHIAALFVVHEGQGFTSKSTEAFDELFGAGAEQ